MDLLIVALYARDSTGNIDAVERQLNRLKEYAEQNSMEIYSEYADISGWQGNMRPGIDKLLEDGSIGAFQLVLVVSADRLSRVVKGFEEMRKRFDNAGIPVLFLDEFSNEAWEAAKD